jgi:phosphomannomutase
MTMPSTMGALAAERDVRFGTSGVRGLVANMSDPLCYAYTQAFLAALAGDAQQIVVGHDLRPSSPRIAAACIQAIGDAGRTAIFAGALPTPAVAYYCALHKLPGIIITGSHIPFDRNGIKFYRADGEIDKADEQAIQDAAIAVPADLAPNSLPPVDASVLHAYIARYVDFFGERALAGKHVALYEHSSVARDVLRTILEALGARVLSLGRTDTFVPIDTEAVRPEDIAQARVWASEHRFDALLSTDGDADRPLIGDADGVWMRGDVVGILCAQFLKADVVVTPVSSNTAAEQSGAFRSVLRTRIGSPYVIAGMQAAQRADGNAVVVGYEANGGFLLGCDIGNNGSDNGGKNGGKNGGTLTALPTRDAVLPMLALLALATREGCTIAQLTDALPRRFTASDRIAQVPTAASGRLLAALDVDPLQAAQLMAPASGEVLAQDSTDGLRLTFASGDVVHLRPSGNAPELRCYAEADTQERAQQLCMACLQRVAAQVQGMAGS